MRLAGHCAGSGFGHLAAGARRGASATEHAPPIAAARVVALLSSRRNPFCVRATRRRHSKRAENLAGAADGFCLLVLYDHCTHAWRFFRFIIISPAELSRPLSSLLLSRQTHPPPPARPSVRLLFRRVVNTLCGARARPAKEASIRYKYAHKDDACIPLSSQ